MENIISCAWHLRHVFVFLHKCIVTAKKQRTHSHRTPCEGDNERRNRKREKRRRERERERERKRERKRREVPIGIKG